MRNKDNTLLKNDISHLPAKNGHQEFMIENEDELQGVEINYTDFCKDARLAFPIPKVTLKLLPSSDILAEDFNPQ